MSLHIFLLILSLDGFNKTKQELRMLATVTLNCEVTIQAHAVLLTCLWTVKKSVRILSSVRAPVNRVRKDSHLASATPTQHSTTIYFGNIISLLTGMANVDDQHRNLNQQRSSGWAINYSSTADKTIYFKPTSVHASGFFTTKA